MFCRSLKPLDIEFMKRLHDKVNIIPLIAKSDTMTQDECREFKKTVNQHNNSMNSHPLCFFFSSHPFCSHSDEVFLFCYDPVWVFDFHLILVEFYFLLLFWLGFTFCCHSGWDLFFSATDGDLHLALIQIGFSLLPPYWWCWQYSGTSLWRPPLKWRQSGHYRGWPL